MFRFRALLVVFALVAVIAPAQFTPAVEAAGQGSCSINDPSVVQAFENTIENGGGDYIWLCSDKTSMPIVGGGVTACDSNPTWSNCISSARIWVPAGTKFCVYDGTGYSNYLWSLTADPSFSYAPWGWNNLPAGVQNKWSSHRWIAWYLTC